jgi:hypothetical protein
MADEGEKLALSTSVRRFHPHYLSSKAPTLFINLYSGCAVQDVAMSLGLGTLVSRRVLVPRPVSPRRVNENILHYCSKRAFMWRNEVTSVSVFNIVVACL